MANQDNIKSAIQSVIISLMDKVMTKVLVTDPFIPEEHHAKRPIYASLVPDEIFKGSHFERRFVTPFGDVWESLAVVVANEGLGFGTKGHRIDGVVRTDRLRRISEVINRLEHAQQGQSRIRPDWQQELDYILTGGGTPIPVTVICDVYAEDINEGEKLAFEIKAPLPNSDQTKVSKEKLLKLYSMEIPQVTDAYYALPYNPYGSRDQYAWSFPARWFNMQSDKTVLIGDEFWDRIGGPGTYQAFIEAINEIGPQYRERIYKEFLGIPYPSTPNIKL